jgi:restriction system protein
LCLL